MTRIRVFIIAIVFGALNDAAGQAAEQATNLKGYLEG